MKKRTLNAPKPFDYVIFAVLILFACICLYPFISMLLISFASEGDYYSSYFIVIPWHFNVDAYRFIFTQGRIHFALLESILVSVGYTFYALFLTSLGAYALSNTRMPGNRIFFIFVLITMFFGGGLIPFYLTVKGLGMIDNPLSLIIPFGVNAFYMIILRNFFRQVPKSIIESCKLDGANEVIIFFRFMLPLAKAGLITIGLFYFVDKWNDWYWPMLFIHSSDLNPLALEIRNMLSGNTAVDFSGIDLTYQKGKEAAMVVFAILPIMAIVPFCQKFLVKGIMIGSVKE